MGDTTTYIRIPFDSPARPDDVPPCTHCGGLGVTDEQYLMTTERGQLVIARFCPSCDGCGHAAHGRCNPTDHATFDVGSFDDELDDIEDLERAATTCPSCRGRGWWAVTGWADAGKPDSSGAMWLRMPCGCQEARAVVEVQ